MKKGILFGALFFIAVMIIISGIFFSIYAYVNQASFRIMGSDFPGFIFGLIAVFLGVRYSISLFRLKKKIESTDAKFSWNNFKKTKSI